MRNSSKRDARKAARAELARKALELRKAGATMDQIAKQLSLSNRSVAWKLIQQAIRKIIQEPAEDVLHLELQRLDALLLGVWPKAKSGDVQAVDRALRIMERRSAYLGLDAPKRTEHTGKDGASLLTGVATPEAAAALVRQMFGDAAAVPSNATDQSSASGSGKVPPSAPSE